MSAAAAEADTGLKLYPAWRQVEADLLAQGLQDGATIPMDYLRAGFGVKDPRDLNGLEAMQHQMQFNFAIGELCESLLENHRIKLRLVEGVGYMVIPPGEQTRLALKDRGAEVVNALNKLARETSFIRVEQLTEDERKANADAQAKVGALRAMVRKRLGKPEARP